MSPDTFKAARRAINLSLWQLGYLLGLDAPTRNKLRDKVLSMEEGSRPISGPVSRLVQAYVDGYRPRDWDDVISGAISPSTVYDGAPRSGTAALGSTGGRSPQD